MSGNQSETEITYEVHYRSDEYVGTDNEKTWFVGTPPLGHDEHSLLAALQLAADFKAGVLFPRGAGEPRIRKTQIVQRVTVGTVILSDDPAEER